MRIPWPNDRLANPIRFTSEGPYAIFDLDGVLIEVTAERYAMFAKGDYKNFNRRGCYAEPNIEMITLANRLHASGIRVVVMTGREGVFLQETAEQLSQLELDYSLLYMREASSTLPGAKEKFFAYDAISHQLPKLSPVFAVDDRMDVLEMWKTLNIPTLLYPSFFTNLWTPKE